MAIGRLAARTVIALHAAAVVAWLAAHQVWPDATWFQVAASYAMVTAFELTIPVALVALWLWDRRWLAAAAVPVVVAAAFHLPYRWPNPAGDQPPPDVRVMTFNVLNQNDDLTAVVDLIERYEPDVVALQEVTDWNEVPLLTLLAGAGYPYAEVGSITAGGTTAVVSRTPFVATREIDLEIDRPAIVVTTMVDGHRIEVASAHLYPAYYVSLERWRDRPAALDAYAEAQARQAEILVAELGREPAVATFLACDCNTRETNRTNDLLADHLTDASRELGWRIGHDAPPGTVHEERFHRVDYHWYRGPATPVGVYRVLDRAGSDHFALIADYALGGTTPRAAATS